MGDRDVDSPQVEEVGDVFDRPVGDDRQNAEIVAVIEGLCEFGRKSDEAPSRRPAAMPTVQLLTRATFTPSPLATPLGALRLPAPAAARNAV
jgi:hypothetical protein